MLNSKQLLVIYDVLVEHCSMLTANKDVHETKEHVRNMIIKNLNESDKLMLDLWIKSQENKQFVIGPGLRKDQSSIVSMKCGFLKRKENFYWIDSYQKRVSKLENM